MRPSRATAQDSGPMWIATPSSQGTCTLYSLPVSRRFAYVFRNAPIAAGSEPSQHLRSAPGQDRKVRRSEIGRLFQLQYHWTGHRVSDTKAATEIFKRVAEG